MVYVFLADGFEEIEALGTIDILRRCGLSVQTLSVTGKRIVSGAHNVTVKADSVFRKNHLSEIEALVLPGGLKGAQTLNANAVLKQVLADFSAKGGLVAAICAAPMVLGSGGLLQGRHATCYPGMEDYLVGATYHANSYVVVDSNIITGCGPAATPYFAFSLATKLIGADSANQVRKDMVFVGCEPQNGESGRVEVLTFNQDCDNN